MSESKVEFIKKVAEIQKSLKSPKSQFNKFGGYNYRNQEDILEAVKPLLGDLVLTMSDEIVEVGGRVYVKSTASLTDGEHTVSNQALAREANEQKGMSEAMLTGSSSSFARKYSLNGLFLIDDTKDADDTHTFGKDVKESPVTKKEKTNIAPAVPLTENEIEATKAQDAATHTISGGSFRRRARGGQQ